MRRPIFLLAACSLVAAVLALHGGGTYAQVVPGPVTQGSQLRLAASAFPSGFQGDDGEAWTAARADTSTFATMHAASYTALGMEGAWYQYYAKALIVQSGGVTVAAPIEIVYLGTVYPDASAATRAFADVASKLQSGGSTVCTYGDRCATYNMTLSWNGTTYKGLLRVVQRANAVAEIRADVPDLVYSQAGPEQFPSNLDGVSSAFVSTLDALVPTSTSVPPTLTPTVPPTTATSIPTVTPTSTPTATPTVTPIPLAFDITSVRGEPRGAKPDPTLKRAQLKKVKVGKSILLSVYVHVSSAPPDSVAHVDFQVTKVGRTVLHRTMQVQITSTSDATYRGATQFKASSAGKYVVHGKVTIGKQSRLRTTTMQVVP